MNGSIYIIKNTNNNKVYIGQTIQKPDIRFKQHLKCLKSNEKQIISKAIKKYSEETFYFEILESDIKTYEELNNKETYYIDKYSSLMPNGYNMCRGGSTSRKTSKLDIEEQVDICIRYQQGESTRNLGDAYGVSHQTISTILRNYDVPIRDKAVSLPDRTSKVTESLMIQMYTIEGMSIKEIAEKLQVSTKTISRAKSRYNIREYNAKDAQSF